jgi:hypothetical protein
MEASAGIRPRPGAWAGLEKPPAAGALSITPAMAGLSRTSSTDHV